MGHSKNITFLLNIVCWADGHLTDRFSFIQLARAANTTEKFSDARITDFSLS